MALDVYFELLSGKYYLEFSLPSLRYTYLDRKAQLCIPSMIDGAFYIVAPKE